jgi:hypothetical protein
MQIKVDPGGEKYVSWAKKQLNNLERARKDMNLPVMRKFWHVDGSLIALESSEFGDSIRINAGTDIGSAYYRQTVPTSLYRELSISNTGKARRVSPAGYTRAYRDPSLGTAVPYFLGQDDNCWARAGLGGPNPAVTGETDEEVLHYIKGGVSVYSFTKPVGNVIELAGVDAEGAFIAYYDNAGDVRDGTVIGVRVINGVVSVTTKTIGELINSYLSSSGLSSLTTVFGGSLEFEYTLEPNTTLLTYGTVLLGGRDKLVLEWDYPTAVAETPLGGLGATYFEVSYAARLVALRLSSAAEAVVLWDNTRTATADAALYPSGGGGAVSDTTLDGSDMHVQQDLMSIGSPFWRITAQSVDETQGGYYEAELNTGPGVASTVTTLNKSGTSAPLFTTIFDSVSTGGAYSASISFRQSGAELFSLGYADWDVNANIEPRQHIKTSAGYGTVYTITNANATDGIVAQVIVSDKLGAKVYAADAMEDAPVPILLSDGEHWVKPSVGLSQGTTFRAAVPYEGTITAIPAGALGFYSLLTSAPPDKPELVDKFARVSVAITDGAYAFSAKAMPTPQATVSLPDEGGVARDWAKQTPELRFNPYGSMASLLSLA